MQNPLIVWKFGAALFAAAIVAAPAMAGVDAVFSNGFESGDTSVWEQPVRYVVFEGFYVPT